MQNKKSLIIVFLPIILILILVIIKSLNKNNFNLDTQQTLELSLNQEHILSVSQIKEKIQIYDNKVLIDLRNTEDYAQDHIKNAINIPFPEILNNQELLKLKSSDSEIILYSNSVLESSKAWTILTQMGYSKLFILDIPGESISASLLEKDAILESDEVLKYKFQPDTLVGLE